MSFRTWIIAVVFGLIATLGQAQDQPAPENHPRQEESVAEGEARPEEDQPQPVDLTPALQGIETAIRDLETEIDKVEQERQRENERRDLDAQESMAWWAKWMFFATAATVVITAAALLAIMRTLHHTRRAADASEDMVGHAAKSTEAALEAVKITREMGIAQSRAYVHVEGAKILVFGKASDHEIGFFDALQVRLKVANTGSTPTKWYEVSAEMSVIDMYSKEVLIEPISIPAKRWRDLSSGTTLTNTLQTNDTISFLRDALEHPSGTLRLSGVVSYETEFDEVRESAFRFFAHCVDLNEYMRKIDIGHAEPVKMARPPEQDD